MNSKVKVILNTVTFILVIGLNVMASTGALNGKTVGEISDKYNTMFTPAAYAFSIWGLIYLMLLLYVGFQWYQVWKTPQSPVQELQQEGIWFTVSNVANVAWILAWIHEAIGLSVIIMLVLLISLIQLVKRLNLERWDAPVRIILFVWWPICIYLGWIILATVANFSAYFVYLGWEGSLLNQQLWTVSVIAIATFIYTMLTFTRSMREASFVGIWGLTAIAYRQWEINDTIVTTALVAIIILLITTIYQAAKNWKYLPPMKIMRGEF